MPVNPSYDRPVKASLHVHLENGETWEATDADLAKFSLVRSYEASTRFAKALRRALVAGGVLDEGADVTAAELNPVRYLVEVAICYPDMLYRPEHEDWTEVAAIERRLQNPGGETQ